MDETNTAVIARLDRATQYSRGASHNAEKPRRTGSPGHRRAEATPSFGRLCRATTILLWWASRQTQFLPWSPLVRRSPPSGEGGCDEAIHPSAQKSVDCFAEPVIGRAFA